MPGTNVGADVKINFSDVQYANGQWSGTPSWDVQKVTVHPGDNNIIWNVKAQSVPAGYTAAFDASNGIEFSGTPAWTGGPPTLQPDGTYLATDNFPSISAPTDYYYSVIVNLVPNAGTTTPGTSFNYDPQVENEPT
jgi:hypothetical protein